MPLEFGMGEKQKASVRRKYEDARGKAGKNGKPIGLLRFIDSCICIKRDLLEEAFQRGYMAIRVKKDGTHYKCFFFEILVPLTRIWLSETDRQINWIHNIQTRPVRDLMEKIIANYLSNNGKLGGRYKDEHYLRYETENVDYAIFMNQVKALDPDSCHDNAFLHTHPYFKEGLVRNNNVEKFSGQDILAICGKEYSSCTPYFLCVLSIDISRFMEEVRKLGGECFDSKGFLKLEHIKNTAYRLAAEQMTGPGLRAFYSKRGVFLIAGQKSKDKPNSIEIFQKLRIT